jgi:hypothetical protein
VRDRFDVWVAFLGQKERPDAAQRVANIRTNIGPADDDIPF